MLRRTFLASLGALSAVGCKSKAQKQADLAVPNVARLEKVIAERHVEALARALPTAGAALGQKLGDKIIEPREATAIGAALDEVRNASEDLRSAKRSFYAITDLNGEVIVVDDPSWKVVGRKAAIAFPPITDVLAGKIPYATGGGRFGGSDPEALYFFEGAPIVRAGKPIGALLSAWEAREAAEDLQRQLQTELAMATVKPKTRAKPKDKYQLVLDTPDLFVAIFNDKYTWMQEGCPQPLEEAVKALSLHARTASGSYGGTFDVANRGWGVAAKRVPTLGEAMGIAVLRYQP